MPCLGTLPFLLTPLTLKPSFPLCGVTPIGDVIPLLYLPKPSPAFQPNDWSILYPLLFLGKGSPLQGFPNAGSLDESRLMLFGDIHVHLVPSNLVLVNGRSIQYLSD